MNSRIQIERKKAAPFVLILEGNADILQPIGQVVRVWDAHHTQSDPPWTNQ